MQRHYGKFNINTITYLKALSALRKPGSIADIQYWFVLGQGVNQKSCGV